MAEMLLGAHESVAGGAWNAIARGRADGCEALQIFARPSSQWRAKPLDRDEVSMFRSEHATVAWPVMSHASYLINLCATDPVTLKRSRDALQDEMLRAEELGIDYVVLHPGAHMGAGRELGIETAAASLSDLHDRTRGVRVRLLLEITAGQGSCLGCRFDDIAYIFDARARRRHARRLLRHLPRARVGDGSSAPKRATSACSTGSRAPSASTACARFTSTTPRHRPAATSIATPRSATATWACCRSGGWSTTRASPPRPACWRRRPAPTSSRRSRVTSPACAPSSAPPPARPAQVPGAAREDRPAPGPPVRVAATTSASDPVRSLPPLAGEG